VREKERERETIKKSLSPFFRIPTTKRNYHQIGSNRNDAMVLKFHALPKQYFPYLSICIFSKFVSIIFPNKSRHSQIRTHEREIIFQLKVHLISIDF